MALADAEAAIAAAKAEVVPGSRADIEHAEDLWRMLRVMANIAIERCDEAQGRSSDERR